MTPPEPPVFPILLAEDDPDDVFFIREAFAQNGMSDSLRVARDGEEALSYLLGEGAFADRKLFPLPSLMLLDLKLPRKSGLEVLAWCRQQPEFKRLLIIVLSSSQAAGDMAQAYDLGANSYLVKPIDSAAQVEMIRALRAYWIGFNKVSPPENQP